MKNILATFLLAAFMTGVVSRASAYTADELEHKSVKALHRLYDQNPKARILGDKAIAVLVFPEVIKAGFMVAAQRGDGVLFKNGQVTGYYNMTSAGYGIQAGVQKLSYALFFMDEDSLKYLKKSDGFDIGAAPGLVVVDKGVAGTISATSLQKGVAAFIFGQKGLMGGLGLQGTKITRYTPSE